MAVSFFNSSSQLTDDQAHFTSHMISAVPTISALKVPQADTDALFQLPR